MRGGRSILPVRTPLTEALHESSLQSRFTPSQAGGAGLAPLRLAGERPALAPGSRLCDQRAESPFSEPQFPIQSVNKNGFPTERPAVAGDVYKNSVRLGARLGPLEFTAALR